MKWENRTQEQKAEVVRHYAEQGHSAFEIASRVGATKKAILGVAWRNNVLLIGGKGRQKGRKPPYKPLPETDIKSVAIPFIDRKRGQCAWIINEDTKRAMCCGNPVDKDHWQEYCKEHAAISSHQREGNHHERSETRQGA